MTLKSLELQILKIYLFFVSLPNRNVILNSSDIAEVKPRDRMGDNSIRTCAAFVYSEVSRLYPYGS